MRHLPDPERWRLIAPLLQEALDLPPDRRAAFLDRACGGDAGLRREIEDLLRADTEAGAFLGAPVDLSAVVPADGDDTEDRPAPPAGATIGPYRVVREIGRGGMGVVYEAEQQRPRRAVALKVILGSGHVDAEAVRMFRRETDSLARLKHPSIAAIYESGSTDEGQHYFAMELVQGRTLSEYLEEQGAARSRRDLRRLLALFRKICAAVAYAHQRGVIHLDLKPSNILVLPRAGGPDAASGNGDPAAPDIKVLDFGLARITDPEAQSATAVTAFGRIQGTLPYMSPEQIRGRRDEVDVRTDVYALGVILYRMLAGRLPHDVEGKDLPEAARIICEQAPRPPRPPQGRSSIDRDLSIIALKALEKDPGRRYAGVTALDEDIARHLDGRPILARSPSAVYQISKMVARNKIPFGAAAALLVLLVAFAAAMTLQARRIALERDRANREATTARRVSEFLTKLFEVSQPNEARGNSITAREILDRGVEKIGDDLADEPEVQARLMQTMANVYGSLGLYKSAIPILEKSIDMQRRTLGEDHLDTLTSMADLGFWYGIQGRASDAEKIWKRILDARLRLLGEEHPDTLEALYYLANALQDQKRYDEEEPIRLRSLAIRRRVSGENRPDTLMGQISLAICYDHQGRFAEAEPLYLGTIETLRSVLGPDHPHTLGSMRHLAGMYRSQRRYPEAERWLRDTVDRERRALGADGPQTLTAANDLAGLFAELGRYAEAEALYRDTLDRRRRVMGEDHPDTAETLCGLGRLFALRGDRAAALDWLGKAVAHGYSQADALAGQPDLQVLRGDPAFDGLLARARKNAAGLDAGPDNR